jgi:antitoxin (DNA-binding transcriptional repressor) of toxin-antitoxin stability system
MKINVSTLLREFPKVRRAAMAGEEVIIATREGNLRLTAVDKTGASILGGMKDRFTTTDDIDEPTTSEADWKPSL